MLLVAAGAWLRIQQAVYPAEGSFAVTHPDQIFQGLEQAHVLRYGFGMVPLEYTHAMAMRSHLMPYTYALVLWFVEEVLMISDYHTALGLLKASHALLTSTLPLATFTFLLLCLPNQQGRPPIAALLSTVLVSFHGVLAGLGALTLANTFVSPFLFAAFGMLLRGVKSRGRGRGTGEGTRSGAATAGLLVGASTLLGLAMHIRPDAAITVIVVICCTIIPAALSDDDHSSDEHGCDVELRVHKTSATSVGSAKSVGSATSVGSVESAIPSVQAQWAEAGAAELAAMEGGVDTLLAAHARLRSEMWSRSDAEEYEKVLVAL
jgi:hypothetical protein